MSTRSYIGLELPPISDGRPAAKARGMYCHWDGYPSGVGDTLVKHYNTMALALAVVGCGYLSGLSEDLEKSFAESLNRDPPKDFDTVEEFYNGGPDGGAYYYLFRDGKWHVSESGMANADWQVHVPVPEEETIT